MAVVLPRKHHNVRSFSSFRPSDPSDSSYYHEFDDLLISCIFPNKKPKALLRINTKLANNNKKFSAHTNIISPVRSSSSSSSASLSPSSSATSATHSGLHHSEINSANNKNNINNYNNNNNNNYTLNKPPPSLILANDNTGVINVALPRRLSQPKVLKRFSQSNDCTEILPESSVTSKRPHSFSRSTSSSLSSLPNHRLPQHQQGSPRLSLIKHTLTQTDHNPKKVKPSADKRTRQGLPQHVSSNSLNVLPASSHLPSSIRSSSSASFSKTSSVSSILDSSSALNVSVKTCQTAPMPSKSSRGIIATPAVKTPKANPLPGFVQTLELSPDPTDPDNITRSKQAINLANLFINYTVAKTVSPADLRRNASTGPQIHIFHNSIQDANSLVKSGSKLETAILDSFKRNEITPSPQTIHRAQKARANMEIHYDLLATSQGIVTQPEGIDSEEHKKFAALPKFYCYNPLQVIRNRKARTPFVALERQESNASSSAGHHFWTVDISELIVDQSWRYQNYHLMRDVKGKLLYPETDMVVDRNLTASKSMIVSRLNKLKQNLTSSTSSRSRNSSVSDYASTDIDFLSQQNIDEKHRTGIFDVAIESVQKSKPLDLHSDSTSINNHKVTAVDNNNSKTNILSSDKKSNSSFNHTSSLRNSLVAADDERRKNSTDTSGALSAGSNKFGDLPTEPESLPAIDMELKVVHAAATELSCLELIYLMRYLFIGNKSTVMSNKTRFVSAVTREIEAKQISAELHQQIRAVQHDVFPRVKKTVQQTEVQFQTLRRTQLSKTSTRIDQLLVDTDQTINRLATTLNLEVKQLGERLDSLESSAAKVHCKWIILSACYLLLEYFLVFLMWIVWGLVSIMLGVRRVGIAMGSIIKWLLWC